MPLQTTVKKGTRYKRAPAGGIEYDAIRLIYAPTLEGFVFDPSKYESYSKQFFRKDGSIDSQRGFVFYKNSNELFRILVDDEDNKITTLKEYLFGKGGTYETLVRQLNNNSVLSAKDIKDLREQIISLKDENQRKELYLELQKKVPYHSQRDNSSPATDEDIANNAWMAKFNISTAGDIMCNLTSEAMCLEYLGVEKPCKDCPTSCNSYNQLEDYLECVRIDKEIDHRGQPKARETLATLFNNVSYKYEDISSYDKTKITNLLKPYLDTGCSVLLSSFGHIVRLQDITETGLIVDDPYGKVVDFSQSGCSPKYKKNGKDYRNGEDYTDTEGNDNIWTWSDLKDNNIKIKCAEIYCTK